MKTTMNTTIRVGLVTLAILVMTASDAGARGGGGRGGGGGGRGGGGGMSRPSPSMGRSPSMSRPSGGAGAGARPGAGVGARPGAGVGARPGAGVGARPGAGGRPSAGDLQGFLNIGPSTGAIGAGRPGGVNLGAAGSGAAAAFLQGGGVAGRASAGQLPASGGLGSRADNQAARAESRAGNQATRSENRANNQAGRVENRQQLQDNRSQRADELRNQVLDNHPRLDFWSDHPNWAAWRINRPYRWATWGALTGWVGGYGGSEAVPYSYGEDMYYQDGTVYSGDQAVASAEEYTQQAEAIVASAPDVAPKQADWMPLGVFALTQDGQAKGPDPSLFLQLAISKEGVISGTLNNTATNSTQTIEGMADKETQRCAWAVAGKTRPIMETGLVNLTKNAAPALVHFADEQTQQWLMVRLDEPSAQKK